MKKIQFSLILALLCSCGETQTNRYSSREEVIKDGAIQRGWIPEIIPNSSFNIVETHNIENNHIDGSLEYKETDEAYLEKTLPDTMIWEHFKFTIDTKKNYLYFKNKNKD